MTDHEKALLEEYRALRDGLSDMIKEGRLIEDMIPDDYTWLMAALERCARLET